jgi:phosphatidylinositol alpha-1,6-mannosyltransferase
MNCPKRSGIILVTCEYPPFPGGIGTYAGRLAHAVRDAGFSVTVIAPSYPDLPQMEGDKDTHRILRHHRINPLTAIRLLSIILRAPEDRIILAADIRSVLILFTLRNFHRRAYRVMVHGSEASKFVPGTLLYRFIRKAYLTADLVAYNSRATQEIFCRSMGRPTSDSVTYLGVDTHWFEPCTGEFLHPELAALRDIVPVISSVGRIEPRKGQREMIQVLARSREAYGLVDPVYVIAGRLEDNAYIESVVQEAGRLSVRVIVTGRLSDSDLKRLYRRSVCHCLFARALPGRIEGFGLVLLEAAAQMCPSVSTIVGGIPEVMGETGTLVDADDIDAAARAVAAYFTDPELRKRHAVSAHMRAKLFVWSACAKATFPELGLTQAGISDEKK